MEMGLIRRTSAWVRERFAAGAVGRVIAQVVPMWRAGRPVPVEHDRKAIAREGYTRESLIHACIKELATSAAEPLFAASQRGVRLGRQTLLGSLAAEPNPNMTVYDYTERVVTDLHIHGEAIIWKRRSDMGIIRELWPLRVDRVEVIPNADGSIRHYLHADDPVSPRDILHIKFPHPLNDYRGLSPIYVLLVEGTLDHDAIMYLGEFFRNGGVPSVVITSSQELTEAQRAKIKSTYVADYGRIARQDGRLGYSTDPLVLSNGATIQPLGVDPSKLNLGPIFDVAESRICSVFGVPAVLVQARIGLLQATAYGTAREARKSLWGETLSPLYERLSQAHTLGVAREFGPQFALRYDLSTVQALKEARSVLLRDAVLAQRANTLTRDEARRHAGYDEIDGRDVWQWQIEAAARGLPEPMDSIDMGRPLPEPVGDTRAA